MNKFNALRIYSEAGKVAGRVVEAALDELSGGEVVFKIDATGVVISSGDARYQPGDEVICTSYDFGVAHDGGYSQVCRVPADWVVPLPKGLTLFDAAALGVAGYTAGLAMELLELNGMAPGNGKVLVNGATGGVATLAIDMLSRLGYHVVAVTGKDAEHEFLRKLGAAEVLPRQQPEPGSRPLEKALWAAAFDSVVMPTPAAVLEGARLVADGLP
ncbi:MAG: oxidoreductase, partial [Betaproteobacteria bacterium]|nr:oxidoreductase [Betaproteobacteria bacterium]